MLRPYQITMIEKARDQMRAGVRAILLQSPTGSGKTVLTAEMVKTCVSRGMISWFLVHRRELVKQSVDTFAGLKLQHGVIAAGWAAFPQFPVQIASVQTLANHFKRYKRPDLIFWDEAHHVAAGTWMRIFNYYDKAYHLGLTATPERLDGRGLGSWFKGMVHGPSVRWLIDNGYLANYKLFAPPGVNIAGIHTRMGDYVKSELSRAVDKPTITGDAIKEYQKLCPGKRAVAFCVSIEHSIHVANEFIAAGIPAAHIDGDASNEYRDETLRRFKDGELQVLSNVDLFGEGYDLPTLECAILLRPTQSTGLYLQQVGRALRPSPGKDHAIILDHAGNCERHGLPDEERQWSLEGRPSRRSGQKNGPAVRICPKCFAAAFPGKLSCAHCGYVFVVTPREVERAEGDLEEVDAEAVRLRQKQEERNARTLDDLVAVGKRRGYPKPEAWAKIIMSIRGGGHR